MNYDKEFDLKVLNIKRELIRKLLKQCTDKQITFFNRMYKSINDIEEKNMKRAYFQCKKTLEANNE